MTSPVPKPVWIIPPPTTYDVVGEFPCETCGRYHEGVARRENPRAEPRYRDLTDCPENEDFDRRPPKPAAPPAPEVRPEPEVRTVTPPVEPHFELNPPPPPGWPGDQPPPPPRGDR